MTQIQDWLNQFKHAWKNGNIDKVLNLFTEAVNYYETPSQKLEQEELREQ
jgi:hypothetical protein